MYCGYAQVAKHLKLPCQAYMALSDSKFNDPQAGMETGVGAFLAACAGINSVSGPGMLEYVNCFSLEKLVFDDEVVAHAKRFIRPVEVTRGPARGRAPGRARAREAPPDLRAHARSLARGALPARAHDRPHQLGPVGRPGLPRLARARQRRHRRDARQLRGRAPRGQGPHRDPGPLPDDLQRRGGITLPALVETAHAARLRPHEPAPLRGQARARQADDRGRAGRGPSGHGGARGRPDRGDAGGGRGLQAQPHLRARGAARRPRDEGGHGGAEAAARREEGRGAAPPPSSSWARSRATSTTSARTSWA